MCSAFRVFRGERGKDGSWLPGLGLSVGQSGERMRVTCSQVDLDEGQEGEQPAEGSPLPMVGCAEGSSPARGGGSGPGA